MFPYQAQAYAASPHWSSGKKSAWQQLQQQAQQLVDSQTTLVDFFQRDAQRAANMRLNAASLTIDFSKNWLDSSVMTQLHNLLQHSDFDDKRRDLFAGKNINRSENRPALHTLLRAPTVQHAYSKQVHQTLNQLEPLVSRIQQGQWLGATGRPIRQFIHIGIGGSDLGPRLLLQALTAYHHPDIQVRFVANIDPADFYTQVIGFDAHTTAFILCSKSFSTLETLHNGELAKRWLTDQGITNVTPHLLAISANVAAAQAFGVAPEHILPMWDWVGGRYSITSAVALPAMIAIGMESFKAFLQGAYAMDQHFEQAPITANSPVANNAPATLALLSCWYRNFLGAQTHGVIPYCQLLHGLPAYLQQLVMESNGKSVDQDGHCLAYPSSYVVWGNVGTNSQHSFHQLLHQGTSLCPVDVILPLKNAYGNDEDHRWVIANALAQTHTLMQGTTDPSLPAHRVMPGNRPSTLITLPALTPFTLGNLIALYEHKTFVESCVWHINPFDQWGVELGKHIGVAVNHRLNGATTPVFDPSTEQYLPTAR